MFEALVLYLILAYRFGIDLAKLSYDWLDLKIEQAEHKFGPRLWSALLSAVLLVAAGLYARPAMSTSSLGTFYAQLASEPFGSSPNPVGLRILTPLISYALGLRGELIIITNLLIAGLLIYLVYRHFRRTSPRPGDAFIAAAAIAFSLVTLTTLYFGGYCDSLTYLIVFLMWRWRSRPVYLYGLLFLGMVNRESIAFLIPWFAYLTYRDTSGKLRWFLELAIGLSLSLGLYWLYREWMVGMRVVQFNSTYYLDPLLDDPLKVIRISILRWPIGLFSVFKLVWVAVAVAAASLWLKGRRTEVYSMAILLLCALAQLPVAKDTSRYGTLAFMVVILAFQHLFEQNAGSFRRWIGWVLLGSLAVPQLYVTGTNTLVMQPLIFNLLASHFSSSIG